MFVIQTTYMKTDILHNITSRRALMRLLLLAVILFVQCSMFNVFGQAIKINGNVYGGGNAGPLDGSTNVTVYAGEIKEVYGGARQADVKGRTFVHLDGAHSSDDIFIVNVFGGNDISGKIGQGEVTTTVPTELENTTNDTNNTDTNKNVIDTSWKTFVRTSACTEKVPVTVPNVGTLNIDANMLVVGNLFGGSNGDYDYTTAPTPAETTTDSETGAETVVKPAVDNPYYGMSVPENSKVYLEIKGGCIAHVYGGGNNATVTEATTIHIENTSDDLEKNAIRYAAQNNKTIAEVINYFQSKVNMTTFQSNLTSWAFNHARVFGGNNKVDMDIMPKWNLQKGIIRDLYSGGNEGGMIYEHGILLEINPATGNKDKLEILNVYGGCRRADVRPMKILNGVLSDVTAYSPDGYNFPVGLSARTLVRGGKITNVYGGNDISGKVYGGNAVGIYASILGNVYGGGNGSYAYTDNANLATLDEYKDFYYNPGGNSVEALNAFRPNAEQVSIRLYGGEDPKKPIVIRGSVFVGGNSATLKKKEGTEKPRVELKIGSNVIANNVFLGNNGENMIKYENENDVLKINSQYVGENGKLSDTQRAGWKYSSLDLKDNTTFKKYMEGCAMDLIPSVVFDNTQRGDLVDYTPYTAYIGSFFCGGNVGSMTSAGTTTIDFSHRVVIFDKLVGGCNSAIVEASDYNTRYEGGLIGENTDDTGNKLVLNLSGLKIQPKRWKPTPDLSAALPDNYLMWNTIDSRNYDVETKTYPEMNPVTEGDACDSNDDDLARRLFGGNIYGGCCKSGVVNGNVVINLNETIIERDKLFDVVESGELGEENSLYGASQTATTKYHITKRNTGVILGQQGMDVFGQALNVFGGGKGKDTEIWGSTTINLNKGYTFQIFGGSEEGTIGKPTGTSDASDLTYTTSGNTITYTFNGKTFKYDPAYSCYVNLCGTVPGVSKGESNQNDNMADCEFMYGGGFFGPICGNTVINLGAGRIFNSFAGSCNADILGHTETYIGRQVKNANKERMGMLGSTEISTGSNTYILDNDTCYQAGFTWIRDITYGANDLGGRIFGSKDFTSRVRKASDPYGLNVLDMVHKYNATTNPNPEVLKAGAYTEYLQGRADAIFGGCYGTYDYSNPKFKRYTYTTDSSDETPPSGTDLGDTKLDSKDNPLFYKPRVDNAFVNFRPTYSHTNNVVKRVYGAGQGQSGEKERDMLQDASYVLIDIPQIAETSGSTGTEGASGTANFNKYDDMEVFGAGAWGGVGMREYLPPMEKPAAGADATAAAAYNTYLSNLDKQSAIIDLVRGDIGAAYGASYEEGVTRRTVVNVPQGSTIKIGSIFGGGYGTETYKPCDVYEAHVEYHSPDAVLVNNRPRVDANGQNQGNRLMLGAIYGGNNNQRRTLYGFINIDVPVRQSHYQYGMTTGNVYGAGYGSLTWNEYTQIDLKNGANVYEVYGGGEAGGVMSAESVAKYYVQNPYQLEANAWKAAWTLGSSGYDPADFAEYHSNTYTNLNNPLTRTAEMDDRSTKTYKYNTNVIIHEGAYVGNYAYAGGFGTEEDKFAGSGDVYGTTYVALLGGTVNKDIYAAGTSGAVYDLFGAENFTASANAYIKGGTVRNVYGGGWRGSVGYHSGSISHKANIATDRDGESHIVIGDAGGNSLVNGIPSITRNVYGGGEGGAIFGDAYVTVNNGYIGYRYNSALSNDASTELDDRYVPELDDAAVGDNLLEMGGNVFGGGYVANSYVDRSHVTMYDGIVRGGLYGGGEIGPIGRGTVHADSIAKYSSSVMHDYDFDGCQRAAIYKGGQTNVYLYGGHVMRDVFGGGRGYDNWGGEGYMTDAERVTMDRSSKGYVFGQTNVHIYGGEIGTEANVLQGHGNVFGGGNEGFVYSATGKKVGSDRSDEHLTEGVPTDGGGFYYESGDKTKELTRDCYVEIAPKCKVIDAGGVTIGSNTYSKGKYVPLEDLNKLGNWNGDGRWAKLDTRGVIIHNALFAGGNITEGSDKLFANTITVYGNAGASLRDVFNIDLVTLGTEELGGIYGDGNLTLVDGFREVHIDNYGTDYYSLNETMELQDYYRLTERQKAYYKLKYVSGSDHVYEYYECKMLHTYEANGETYKKGKKVTAATYATFSDTEKAYWVQGKKTYQKDDQIEEGEYVLMDETEQAIWTLFGVTSIYAGRPLNTIQRADMCGVFGSRMVLKGAQDRVPEAVDYTNYTINRVDEVSLNKSTQSDEVHGNYFGIYNVVNYLGNLTSDVFFDDVRKTDSKIEANKENGQTYYQWKFERPQAKNRNNGISHNKVALASGVYLEIKREEGELTGTDDWGFITGIIELDLINVMQGMGGGYVYARNEHGVKTWHGEGTSDPYGKVTMLEENNSARTYRRFTYAEGSKQVIETSGNFVHNTKQIVDDCYPNSGMYNPDKAAYEDSPAHYWFIRGSIYVYDQYISAYTGSANAYAEKVEMPLTIAAASNGRMTLREVQPNYYAYYDKNGNKLGDTSVNADERLIINNKTYYLNDPVSYWDYRLMSDADRSRFEKETYVVIEDCKIGAKDYPKGTVLTYDEYNTMKQQNSGNGPAVTYTEGDVEKSDGNFFYFFRSSNNISHDTGYLLTYEVNNPGVWNKYYTKTASPAQANKLNTTQYEAASNKSLYTAGPTFTVKSGSSVFGQEEIKLGAIINGTAYTSYTTNVSSNLTSENRYKPVADGTTLTKGFTYYTSSAGAGEFVAEGVEVANGTNYYLGQANVAEAYVVTKEYSVKDAGVEVQHLNPGTPVYQSKYTAAQWTAMTGGTNPAVVKAMICKKLLEFSSTDYYYVGQLLTAEDYAAIKAKVIAKHTDITTDAQAATYLTDYIDNDAYYCTKNGLYGGTYFETGKAYRAIDTWCSMSDADRTNFVYNYDALDLLVDPTFSGRLADTYDLEEHYGYKPQYDGYAPGSARTEVEAGTASAQHDGSTPLRPAIYSKTQPIEYQAECTKAISYTNESNETVNWAVNSAQASWLTREQYEAIPNEQHHYSPITVTEPGEYYVVKTVFMRGDIPYTLGQQIDNKTYTSLTPQQQANIDVVEFPSSLCSTPTTVGGKTVYDPIDYFYCREPYTINEKGEGKPVKAVVANANGRKSNGETEAISADATKESGEVPAGFIIAKGASATDQYSYQSLPNFQTGNFLIHGTSPTEVSTLYVSSESDINDLSKEKIITVIYLYEYEESDESGQNVTPVSERHIVNIHINFKSGVPEIGEIAPPKIVLPGTTLGLNIPEVTEGAYRVTESGWEIFADGADATTHYNGQPYINNETPVYWYQNNYWLAYYAKTRLGKSYSNSVPVSVANFHDLKKVMNDTKHHYYIDHKDVGYEPKIYINDYSNDKTGSKSGLDLFKDLIDLSHKTLTYDSDGNPEPYNNASDASDPLNGHVPLDNSHATKPMRGGQYLKFYLNADQDHGPTTNTTTNPETGVTTTTIVEHPWTPIANNEGECFNGVLHGDGHTISGLTSSLFNHLCGDVYNLGVTGSFTGAGVAETGGGYVENCWINTTGTPDGTAYAVFGAPTAEGTTTQIVNSYYQSTKNYKTTGSAHGLATPMPDKSFYNGEVAYDLNGFYLWKRYCDQTVTTGDDNQKYQYFTVGSDNKLAIQEAKYYASDVTLCSSGYNGQKYVEDRFKDGDFIYVGDGFGTIPNTPNERLYTYVENEKPKSAYYPIWPDDYIFFGQALNYGHMDGKNGRALRTQQPLPSVISKSNDRVLTTDEGNRVYRAPAYFRSKNMGVAYFNPYAVFAAEEKLTAEQIEANVTAREVYPRMTAIDFTGQNDANKDYLKGWQQWSKTSLADDGSTTNAYAFFPPLLDDGGVYDFFNADLTQNLLAYTMTTTPAATQTNDAVSAYMTDVEYSETNSDYHTVDQWNGSIGGHWVQKSSAGYVASRDHMLVDKQDYNAPIGYTFGDDYRMWYQRMPDNYVEPVWSNDATPVRSSKGWEGVSLPFKADIVTTDVKGEITHFYADSKTAANNSDAKIGHEYWLRQFKGNVKQKKDENNQPVTGVYTADFNYPTANSADGNKDYTNTFLWDYYYKFNDYKDLNSDKYQENDERYYYYKYPRTIKNYPRLAAAMPYIIGFPSKSYYEFDLSGKFEATTAWETPTINGELLGAQTITFASKPGATINVSDTEIGEVVSSNSANGCTFMPSYLNNPDVTEGKTSFILNAEGNSYVEDKTATKAAVVAFRPYFEAGTITPASSRQFTRSIVFSDNISSLGGDDDADGNVAENLIIESRQGKIIVTSALRRSTDIRIVNVGGQTVDAYTIQPGQTVETPVAASGVYIVRDTYGRHLRKLLVK